jgi:hypothetical protein
MRCHGKLSQLAPRLNRFAEAGGHRAGRHFATLPDGAKWILAFAMLLGRLELFTVLVLVTPRFWRG